MAAKCERRVSKSESKNGLEFRASLYLVHIPCPRDNKIHVLVGVVVQCCAIVSKRFIRRGIKCVSHNDTL